MLLRILPNSTTRVNQLLTRSVTTLHLAGSGNPYETKITRRRQVADPSMPNFKGVECLKWTNWRMYRDVKRRHFNAEYWQYRQDLLNISTCKTLPNIIRDIAWEERLATPRESSANYLVNRCAITSRPRGKFPRYRLSRIIWRDLSDHGLLSGVIRAKW